MGGFHIISFKYGTNDFLLYNEYFYEMGFIYGSPQKHSVCQVGVNKSVIDCFKG